MDCWGSCWAVLMGKISQAERWILFVMLHCPPSTQSAKEASSVVLSLSLSVSLGSLDIVYLHQLPLPSYIPLLLPPYTRHGHMRDVNNTHDRQSSLKYAAPASELRNLFCFFSYSISVTIISFTSACSLQVCSPATIPPSWGCQNKSEKERVVVWRWWC